MRAREGFTLIELLLVVFILALVAGSASMVIDEEDKQARYEETLRRAEAIRTAIVGHAGAATPSGYVADVGAMPSSVEDLIRKPPTVSPWSYSTTDMVFSGWRGPYLQSITGRFHDGWGNDQGGTPGDFGWSIDPKTADTWVLRSLGADRELDQDPTAEPDPYNRDVVVTIGPDDHSVNVRRWQLTCTITTAVARSVHLRLRFPGEPATPYASDSQSIAAASTPVLFTFPDSSDQLVPWGSRGLELVDSSDDQVLARRTIELWPRTARPSSLAAPWVLP